VVDYWVEDGGSTTGVGGSHGSTRNPFPT